MPSLFQPGDLGALRAALRAGSDAAAAMRAEAVRQVTDRRGVRAGAARRAMSTRSPTAAGFETGLLAWSLDVAGAPMPVAAYPHRQVREGVSAQIKAGTRAIIRHAFVATMDSGHEGVFVRTGRFGRRGNPKLERIRELYTTTVADVLRDEGVAEAVTERGKAVFRSAFSRNMRAVGRTEIAMEFGAAK